MVLFNKVLCLHLTQHLYKNIKKCSTYARKGFNNFKNWKEKFSDVLIEPSNVSKETWESLRNFTLESTTFNKMVVDSFLLTVFKMEKCPDIGINYYKFLQTNNYNISRVIETNYLLLYEEKNELTEADKADILDLCKSILKKHVLLSVYEIHAIVIGFCKLDKWKEAIEVINRFEVTESSGLGRTYHILIECLLKNDELELVDKYLAKGMKKCYNLNDTYIIYLKYCLKNRDIFNERTEKLFLLWRKYDSKLDMNVINVLKSVSYLVGWSAKVNCISGSKCNACHQMMKETSLSNSEFKHLCEAVIKNVITHNKYRVSDPEEWNQFTTFINKHKPYDFIIDGLNSFMAFPGAEKICAEIVKKLKSDGNKILLIGRSHLMKKPELSHVLKTTDYFLVNNLSKDDAFILYATFIGGNNAKVLSRDLMRQHKYSFNDIETDVLFRRWQMLHQYMFTKLGGLITLHSIRPLNLVALKIGSCWHIPYNIPHKHTSPKFKNLWACFNMRP